MTSAHPYCICLDDVERAAKRIEGNAHVTPVLTSRAIDKMANNIYNSAPSEGKEVCSEKRFFFKVEAMQRTGSFKFRGALNAVLNAKESVKKTESGNQTLEVVTHSSGNHAQALALAASVASDEKKNGTAFQVKATIVMPRGAPATKQEAVSEYGARVILVENTNEAREEEAERIRQESGAVFIHPSENPFVIAGQGTAGLEMIAQTNALIQSHSNVSKGSGHLDAVIIPVGGGGLASGNTIAVRGLLGDNVKIILAEPEELNDAKRSKDAGQLMGHDPSNPLNSVADGLKTTLGPNTWPIVRDLVDDIITVSEKDILMATRIVWERLKVCIEPSAGVGVAVALSKEFALKYGSDESIVNVGIILCGGNVNVAKIASMMART